MFDNMCCKNELNLCKLCSERANIKCLNACDIKTKDLCSSIIKCNHLMVEQESVNNICVSETVTANLVQSLSVNTNDLCSKNGVINNLCVNDLTVGTLKYCEKYVASVTFSGDTSYTLGSNIDWNSVIYDPNNNISLSPFFYTVPVTGYYTFSYYINSNNLNGPTVIAGIPVGVMTAQVNGVDLRKSNAPFLSFVGLQYTVLSSLVLLNAGDKITMKYEVLVLDPTSGLILYPGNVLIKSTGVLPVLSGFDIHYLSSTNCTPVICAMCPTVQLPCNTIIVDCNKSSVIDQDPCDSCQ